MRIWDEGRQHYLDALRALLMLIGIPFHASLIYNWNFIWVISSPDKSDILTDLGEFLHVFRMPAFFMVSGYFAILMVRRRGPGTWFASRCLRLGLPFFCSMLLLQPVPIIAASLAPAAQGDISFEQALDVAYARLTSFGPQWIEHLWFLPVLLLLSLIFVALIWPLSRLGAVRPLVERFYDQTDERPKLLAFGLILAVPMLELVQIAAFGRSPFSYISHVLIFFGLGVVLGSHPNLPRAFRTLSWGEVGAAMALCALAVYLRLGPVKSESAYLVVGAAGAALMSKVLLGALYRFLNEQNSFVRRVVDSSFSIYLVHQPIIIVIATLFCFVALPIGVEFLLIVVATAILSFWASLFIGNVPILALMFNGTKPASWSGLFTMRAARAALNKRS